MPGFPYDDLLLVDGGAHARSGLSRAGPCNARARAPGWARAAVVGAVEASSPADTPSEQAATSSAQATASGAGRGAA